MKPGSVVSVRECFPVWLSLSMSEFSKVGNLDPQQTALLIKIDGNWVKVLLGDGSVGYVYFAVIYEVVA